jgi:hypothetical protein
MTFTNNDNPTCPVTLFNYYLTVPSDFSGAVKPTSLYAPPGNSTSTVTVISPSTATLGTYSISVKAVKSGNSSVNGSGSAQLVLH